MTNELPANRPRHENPALTVSQRLEQLAQRANERNKGCISGFRPRTLILRSQGKD